MCKCEHNCALESGYSLFSLLNSLKVESLGNTALQRYKRPWWSLNATGTLACIPKPNKCCSSPCVDACGDEGVTALPGSPDVRAPPPAQSGPGDSVLWNYLCEQHPFPYDAPSFSSSFYWKKMWVWGGWYCRSSATGDCLSYFPESLPPSVCTTIRYPKRKHLGLPCPLLSRGAPSSKNQKGRYHLSLRWAFCDGGGQTQGLLCFRDLVGILGDFFLFHVPRCRVCVHISLQPSLVSWLYFHFYSLFSLFKSFFTETKFT